MASRSQDSYIAHLVGEWLAASIGSVDLEHPAHVHLDELLGNPGSDSEYLRLGEVAFASLIRHLGLRISSLKAILVIPLEPSKAVNLSSPRSLSEIDRQRGDEPPSLYVVDRGADSYLEIVEEYKYPLDKMFPRLRDVNTYYRTFRSLEEIRSGWEYTRCVYVEHMPLRFRLLAR